MKTDVLITIKGIQGDLIGGEQIEMVTTGSIHEKNDKIYIRYIDTALDTDSQTKTAIKIYNEQVSITRFGATNTHMIFEKGVSHFTPYETPLGIFEIKTHTNNINIQKKETELKLEVEYMIEIDKMSSNIARFELSATEIS